MKCNVSKCEMHVDHIKPVSLYPELKYDPDNLQVLCRDCNLEKSNKHETDYRTDAQISRFKNYQSTYIQKKRAVAKKLSRERQLKDEKRRARAKRRAERKAKEKELAKGIFNKPFVFKTKLRKRSKLHVSK